MLLTWTIASTIVIVLPVPGGPNTMNGASPDVPDTICCTADICSSFLPISGL